MLAGVATEISRLEYVIDECERGTNPHKLDISFMRKSLRILREYKELHK